MVVFCSVCMRVHRKLTLLVKGRVVGLIERVRLLHGHARREGDGSCRAVANEVAMRWE